jgi:hypothetical protein
LKLYLQALFSSFGTTAVVELGFQSWARAKSERPDEHIDNTKAWLTPIRQRVLCETFKFREIEADVEPEECRRSKGFVPSTMYNARARSVTIKDLKAISGIGATRFQTFNADSARLMHEEMQVLIAFTGILGEASKCWSLGVK